MIKAGGGAGGSAGGRGFGFAVVFDLPLPAPELAGDVEVGGGGGVGSILGRCAAHQQLHCRLSVLLAELRLENARLLVIPGLLPRSRSLLSLPLLAPGRVAEPG